MSVRYDLTAKVEPFLDSALFQQIVAFNDGAAAPAAAGSAPSLDPSEENAQKLYDGRHYLEAYKMLSSLETSSENESAIWGRFAAALLAFPDAPSVEEPPAETSEDAEDTEAEPSAPVINVSSDPVMKALTEVQALLDQRRGDSVSQLNRRAWFIHWSLFAYMNSRLPALVDTIFASQNMSVIQAACPWILRYVAVAVIAIHARTARFDRRVKDLVRVVQQELYEYSDPVLGFVECLFVDYDFEAVQGKLEAAVAVIKSDFFAHSLADKFADSARVLTADTLLRVHESLPLSVFNKVLGLEGDEWAKAYIISKQEAKLDAAFDADSQTLRVTYSKPSINSQVSERLKALDHRAHLLTSDARTK